MRIYWRCQPVALASLTAQDLGLPVIVPETFAPQATAEANIPAVQLHELRFDFDAALLEGTHINDRSTVRTTGPAAPVAPAGYPE